MPVGTRRGYLVGMTTTSTATPSARAGALWGDVDGLIGKLCGARERFMQQRPELPEAEWPAFRDAYDTAMASASRPARGA